MSRLNQKGAAHLLVPILLILGLVAAVYLVTSGNPLKLFSKAGNAPIVFKSLNGQVLPIKNGIYQTTSNAVAIDLTSTLGSVCPKTTSTSGPANNCTVSFRTALNPAWFDTTAFNPYIYEPTSVNVTFPNSSEVQFYWVEFKDNTGKIDRRSAQIQIVASLSQPIDPLAAPVMLYPQDGQTLDLEGAYMFKVQPVAGAKGYLFGLFQNNVLIYENWRDSKKLSTDGTFSLKATDPFHARFKAGPMKVMVRAQVNNKWSAARNITVTLKPRVVPTPTPQAAKRVFVTSTTYNGNLGGVSGADAKCQERANAANLGGIWKAWLSDNTTSAANRLNHNNGPYKLVTGGFVANNWADLTDGWIGAINSNEFRGSANGVVWSATYQEGTSLSLYGKSSSQSPSTFSINCNNWTSNDSKVIGDVGLISKPDSMWTNYNYLHCNETLGALYCFEQ